MKLRQKTEILRTVLAWAPTVPLNGMRVTYYLTGREHPCLLALLLLELLFPISWRLRHKLWLVREESDR